jgi:hypothetical protein
MPKKIIMLVLVCILFPAVVFANQNPNAVPGFDNLTWGESSRSVLQKYHLGRMPLTYDRNETICEISLDNPYIYEIRIMPTALMMFTNDKLYSVTFNFSSYPNDTEYNRIKKIFTEKFGEPYKTETINGQYEYSSWDKGEFFIGLAMTSITFAHNELSLEAQNARDEAQGKNITDWSSYVH